jgi:hypothetical protein
MVSSRERSCGVGQVGGQPERELDHPSPGRSFRPSR